MDGSDEADDKTTGDCCGGGTAGGCDGSDETDGKTIGVYCCCGGETTGGCDGTGGKIMGAGGSRQFESAFNACQNCMMVGKRSSLRMDIAR